MHLEDALGMFGGNADAVVGDGDLPAVVGFGCRDGDLRALFRPVADGVVKQVLKKGTEPLVSQRLDE
jgi:hypothetical protein